MSEQHHITILVDGEPNNTQLLRLEEALKAWFGGKYLHLDVSRVLTMDEVREIVAQRSEP